jgi:hypothetical protein
MLGGPSDGAGPIESAVRTEIAALGDLPSPGATLAELAYRLSAAMDSSQRLEGRELAPVAAQLRETLKTLWEVAGNDDDDPAIAGLGRPLVVPAPLGNGP